MNKCEKNLIKNSSCNRWLSLRLFISFLFAVNGVICVITAVDFLRIQTNFPPWFGLPFLLAVIGLLCIIIFYLSVLQSQKGIIEPERGRYTLLIWLLLIISVICTSALHKFFPFRLEVFDYWQKIPPRHNILRYNFILTFASLLTVILLSVLYQIKQKRLALTGLAVLAAVILIPTCNCGNEFNKIWIRWIGASPLMFMPNSVVILIGCCALLGIWPKVSVMFITTINICVLALGLGHLTGIIW